MGESLSYEPKSSEKGRGLAGKIKALFERGRSEKSLVGEDSEQLAVEKKIVSVTQEIVALLGKLDYAQKVLSAAESGQGNVDPDITPTVYQKLKHQLEDILYQKLSENPDLLEEIERDTPRFITHVEGELKRLGVDWKYSLPKIVGLQPDIRGPKVSERSTLPEILDPYHNPQIEEYMQQALEDMGLPVRFRDTKEVQNTNY